MVKFGKFYKCLATASYEEKKTLKIIGKSWNFKKLIIFEN